MKTIAHILLAAFIGCAATSVAAQAPLTRSLTPPKEALPPAAGKTEAPGAAAHSSPHITAPNSYSRSECRPSWTAKKYKSFDSVQTEIRKRYGEVRILRVALCGEGISAYFQIVILSGQGQVSRVQITAMN
jgi:hypothetical protein